MNSLGSKRPRPQGINDSKEDAKFINDAPNANINNNANNNIEEKTKSANKLTISTSNLLQHELNTAKEKYELLIEKVYRAENAVCKMSNLGNRIPKGLRVTLSAQLPLESCESILKDINEKKQIFEQYVTEKVREGREAHLTYLKKQKNTFTKREVQTLNESGVLDTIPEPIRTSMVTNFETNLVQKLAYTESRIILQRNRLSAKNKAKEVQMEDRKSEALINKEVSIATVVRIEVERQLRIKDSSRKPKQTIKSKKSNAKNPKKNPKKIKEVPGRQNTSQSNKPKPKHGSKTPKPQGKGGRNGRGNGRGKGRGRGNGRK